jgi:phosphate:Na+ symporter
MDGSSFDPALVLGGLGMFLLGMHVMTSGLRSIAGDTLGTALRRSTNSPLSGALVGTVTTALIQSSSATTVAAVGFVSAGVLSFGQALGIIFGANVGTTITGWLVALLGFKLDLAQIALPLILVGIVIKLARAKPGGDLGLALAGFGLIFVGIGSLQRGFAFISEAIDPSWFPGPGLLGALAMVAFGFVLTAITQSSSAGVALALAGVHSGAVPLEHAAAAVIGMDMGSSATALIASLGASTQGRRTGTAHFVFNLLSAVLALLILRPYLWAIGGDLQVEQPELALVGFHTSFNLAGTLIAVPLAGPFARFLERLVPDHHPPAVAGLDEALLRAPELAVASAQVSARRLSEQLRQAVSKRLDSGELESDLEELEMGVSLLRDYLDAIVTQPSERMQHHRHRDLIHASDHLSRLVVRLRRGRVPAPSESPWGPLIKSVARVIEDGDPTVLADHYRRLANETDEVRDQVMARVATDELDGQSALSELATGRDLRRTLHHAYRAVYRIEGSRPDERTMHDDDLLNGNGDER